MVTVRFSEQKELILPQSLGQALGLHEGDRVEVQRQDWALHILRKAKMRRPGSLTDLSRIVSSSRPVGSVDVERFMDRHGYEQVYAQA